MKKAILISIKPGWVEKILNGEKIIEIRKSMPKCDLPIDVYIYCCKSKDGSLNYFGGDKYDTRDYYFMHYDNDNWAVGLGEEFNNLCGKVVAKFTLNKVDKLSMLDGYRNHGVNWLNDKHIEDDELDILLEKICINFNELEQYLEPGEFEKLDYGIGWLWYIDNLQIFDKPMELTDFYKNNWEYLSEQYCENHNCRFAHENSVLGDDGYCPINECPRLRVNKPPQSWQYVFVEEEDEKTN